MNKKERKEKIEQYGKGFELLLAALKDIPVEAWKFKPSPQDWSVHEVIIHLGDSETNAALRARKLIVEPGGVLMGYDQDQWAITLDYHSQSTDDALQITRFARLTTYNLLKSLPDDVFKHTVRHPEYEELYTFEQWLNIYAAHIPGHIEQIQNNYALWKLAN